MKRRLALKNGAMATGGEKAGSPGTQTLNVQTFRQKMVTDGSKKTNGGLFLPV